MDGAAEKGARDREPFSYRNDPGVPAFPDDRPLIVFDGACVMCSRVAQFILRHDRHGVFRLAAAQSPLGRALYAHYRLASSDYETSILLDGGRAYFKSEACLRMLGPLGLPWSLAGAALRLPVGLRDRAYDVIARNRLRLFGMRETCFAPTDEMKARFLV